MTNGLIFDKTKIDSCSLRIAYQIYENNLDQKEIVLAGIEENGLVYAAKIKKLLENISPLEITFVKLKVDKVNILTPVKCDVDLKELENKSIVVIDDVLNTGSTLMFAVKYLLDVPVLQIKTAVLVNRNHKKYPIKADFKGISLSTSVNEHIKVSFEADSSGVYLV